MGLHLLHRSYFLPLANKRRDTIPPEEGEDLQDAVARRPGKPPPPLHKPLKIYLTFSDLRRPPHLRLCLPVQFSSAHFKSLPEHCLRLKKIGTIFFLNKEVSKAEPAPCRKPPQGALTQAKKKKREKREKEK